MENGYTCVHLERVVTMMKPSVLIVLTHKDLLISGKNDKLHTVFSKTKYFIFFYLNIPNFRAYIFKILYVSQLYARVYVCAFSCA